MADDTRTGGPRSGEPPHLRALDWRFLLPSAPVARARRIVMLGGHPDVGRLASEHGMAATITRVLPDDASADVVVIGPDAWAPPSALARALVVGGTLHVEVDRRGPKPRWPALPATMRLLERAGLSVTAAYLVVPSPDGPRDCVPLLHAPGAVRWYVRNVHRPVLRRQRLVAAIVSLLPAWCAGRLARRAPTYAVTARLGAGAAANDGPAVLGPAVLGPARAAGLVPRGAQPLVMAAGGDRVVVLPFADDARRPTVVLKVPRAPQLRARSVHEQHVLRALHDELPASLATALPEPLGMIDDDEAWTAAERYLPGRSLVASSGSRGASRERRLADLRLAAGWLERFHTATERRRVPWGGEPRSGWLDGCVERYRASVGASAAEETLFEAARFHSDIVAHLPCPIVCQHRDFAVWNLARNDDGLAVLDWEGARDGPPLCDLLHLVTSWDLVIRRPADAAAELGRMEPLLISDRPGDSLETAARQAIADYLAVMGIDRRLVPLLLLHHFLELAIRRADQLRDHGAAGVAGAAGARGRNGPSAAVAMLAGHADILFGHHRSHTAAGAAAAASVAPTGRR